jgi:TP901 family phage tail tape measure protein
LGTTKDGVQDLNEQAQDLGATTVFTAKEVVELQTELAKLGYSVQQIQNMAPSVLNFAQATGSSLADAASLAGATLRMFEKDTTDTTEVVDKMVAATTKSALSFSYLQNAMSTVAPVDNAFGFNIEEVLALLGQLANAGFDASSAATATRNILLNLADANGKLAKRLGEPVKNLDDLVKGLKELDAQGVDLNETLELTDKRSVAAFNTFIKGADAAKTLRDELANSNGAAKKMAETMSDNLEGSMKSLTSAWEGFNLHINESNGFLKNCVDWLKDVVVYFDRILTKEGKVKAALDKLQGGGNGKPTKTENMVSFLGDISDKGRREDTYNRQVSEFWRFINKRDAEIKKEENYIKQQRERTDLTAEGEQALNFSLERIQHRIDRLKTENEAAKKMLKQYQQGAEGILKADTETTTTTTTTTKTTTGGKGGKVVKADDIEKEAKKRAQELLKIQQETENLRNAMIEDEYERELAIINTNYERQKAALEKKAADDKQLTEAVNAELVLLEQKKNADIEALTNKHLNKILDEDNKIKEAERRAAEQSIRMQQQAIDMETEIRNLDIDMLEASEKEKTRLRLEAEKERLQKLLALYEADCKKLSDTEKKLIQKQIEGINYELSKNKSRDVYDALGFNLSDEQKDAIDTSVSYATDALNTFMQSYTEAADKKRELADREVERTQQVLQAELEARANGYANDVETARKEVEMAKKQQQQAIENQKKAQRTQIALDTAMQASNLITATTTILKLGFPWFIPALAVMWGTFAAAKVKAWQSVGDSEKYGDGTVELLQGGSHQSGNDIDLGRKPNGTRRRAEGGEFFAVINKRSSRKYRSVIPDVIHSLNNDTFADKYINAYDGGNIIVQGADKAQDLTRLQDDVTAIRKQGESSYSADGRVRRYKNLVQIIN